MHVEQLIFPDEIHDFLKHGSWGGGISGAGGLLRADDAVGGGGSVRGTDSSVHACGVHGFTDDRGGDREVCPPRAVGSGTIQQMKTALGLLLAAAVGTRRSVFRCSDS